MEFDVGALPDLVAFAAANGLNYQKSAASPRFGGAVFEYLENATVNDRFAALSGPAFEVGTVTGTVGGSREFEAGGGSIQVTSFSTSEIRSYGYMAVQLQRALPHLVLDSIRNDTSSGSTIPMPIAAGQRLVLEGDFNNHFLLYAPAGYERDALYVFAPDLMALLIDETGDFDVEIVDDVLFVYSPEPCEVTDAALWQRLARIRTVVGGKAITQTDLYADDRPGVPAGTVSAEGRRLRMGFSGDSGGSGKRLYRRLALVFIVGITGALLVIGIAALTVF